MRIRVVVSYFTIILTIVLVIPILFTWPIHSNLNSNSTSDSKTNYKNEKTLSVGEVIDSYKGVPVYDNGKYYTKSQGESCSDDGYYFGLKWQCVEFVKRFYYIVKKHQMPDGFGNAKDFFDPKTSQGSLNLQRGLLQYRNGGNVKPEPDDILVFTDSKYGHVGIVTEVTSDSLEIIQQNEAKTRETYSIRVKNGHYTVGFLRRPAGWLRIGKHGF